MTDNTLRRRAEDIKSKDSESGIIATMIMKPEMVYASDGLLPEHFSSIQNRYMFLALQELASTDIHNVDAFNIIQALSASSECVGYDKFLSLEQISELVSFAPAIARSSEEEFKLLSKNVKELAFRRETYRKLQECESYCFDLSMQDIAHKIYSELDDTMLNYNVVEDIPEFKDVADELWAKIEERQNGNNPSIEFPFKTLNEFVVLEPGECVCFAAPQKAGKSAMLLTITVNLLQQGKRVLYIDSELSSTLFFMRLMAHLTGIKFSRIRSGNVTLEERRLIDEQRRWLSTTTFIHKYLPMMDDKELNLIAKKAKHKIDFDVIVVDYLKANSNDDLAYSVYSSLGRLSDTIKNKIAGEMNVCALTAAQMATNGRIADSAKIARNVSTVIYITDKTLEEIDSDGTNAPKKLRVAFNRNGAQMNDGEWIDMCFDGSTCKYWESPIQHETITPY